MKKGIILLLCFISAPTFAQWKSYYPKVKNKKKEINSEKEEKDSFLYDTYFFNALKAKSLENYKEALKEFQKCIKLNNQKPLPFYESALINKNQGNLDLAEEQIKIATTLERKNKWYQLTYAEILFSKQNFKASAVEYKKLILLDPGNEEFYYFLADTYTYNKDFLKAIAVYDDLEDKKGVDKMISMQKHKLYMQLQKKKKSINELLKLIEAYPNDVEVLEILSELYLLNDEKQKAFEIFKKLAIIDPENGRVHLTLADYYRENRDNNQSFEELKLAFKSKKLGIDIKVKILVSYFQLLDINDSIRQQADELSELLINTHKGNPKAHAVYADILYIKNKFQEAKKHYLIVLEGDKRKNKVWTQVLFIQAEQKDFIGMLETSREALTYFPTDPLFYYFNGISNKRFNHNNEAILILEMGIEFVIENELLLLEFYISLADLYHATGDNNMSDSLYEKVLNLDSENVLVLNNYAYYLSVRKINLEKAKEMSWKCNQLEKGNGTYQDTYAWILYQLSEYEMAKEWIQKSLTNGGDSSAVIVEHYGDILYQLGDKEGAITQWKAANNLGEASKFLLQKIEERKLYD